MGAFTGTVLLVEDDYDLRNVLALQLASMGFTVLQAGNATSALQIAEAHSGPIRLLLTDVRMPGLTGPALAQRLCASHGEMRVLFMSGDPNPASAYLHKPFTREALLDALTEILPAQAG